MSNEPYLFSSKLDKIFVLARILRYYQVSLPKLDTNLISKLLRANLEDVLIAFDESLSQQETIDDLLKKIPQVRKRKLSQEEKRHMIQHGLQEADKLKRRYLRGYPLKEEETDG